MLGLLNILPVSERSGWPWTVETSPNIYYGRKKWPKISIVTPSYNQSIYLEETIRSILLQNYPNLEYLIIDGGSTDNSVEIIKKYSSWLTFWVSEPDNGQSHAINKGIDKCNGEIFNWINSDDFLEKDALFSIAVEFNQNQVVCSNYFWFYESNYNKIVHRTEIISGNPAKTAAYLPNHQPGTFFKMKVIKGLFPITEKLNFVMDQDLWIRYLIIYGAENIVFIDKIVSNLRIHDLSKTSKFKKNFEKEYNSIYYGLSLLTGESAKANFIKKINNNVIIKDYLPDIDHTYKNNINNVVDYFLFKNICDFYEKKMFDLVKEGLKLINLNSLDLVDMKIIKKTKSHLSFLFFYKLFKSI